MSDQTTAVDKRKDLRSYINSFVFIVIWCGEIALILLRAPFWSILLLGIVGWWVAWRDWRHVHNRARKEVLLDPRANSSTDD